MAGKANSKLKTLVLMDILREKTDEDHPMSAAELCQELGEYNIDAERKSIYSDIEVLQDYGMDIIKTTTPKKGFFLGDRDFELAELRLLVDAVQSAGFIPEEKTKALKAKIQKVCSVWQRKQLDKQVYVDGRYKTANKQIYYIIDALSRAIDQGDKVKISYTRRSIVAGDRAHNETRIFKVTPYATIWQDDHYYLVCNNEKYDNFMHVRIERINQVEAVEDEKARPCSAFSNFKNGFDCSTYITQNMFHGYSGEPEVIQLRCDNDVLVAITDRFGEDVVILDTDEDTFTVRIRAAVSDGLVKWLLEFGNKVLVVAPDSLREEVVQTLKDTLSAYQTLTAAADDE